VAARARLSDLGRRASLDAYLAVGAGITSLGKPSRIKDERQLHDVCILGCHGGPSQATPGRTPLYIVLKPWDMIDQLWRRTQPLVVQPLMITVCAFRMSVSGRGPSRRSGGHLFVMMSLPVWRDPCINSSQPPPSLNHFGKVGPSPEARVLPSSRKRSRVTLNPCNLRASQSISYVLDHAVHVAPAVFC